MLTPNNINGNLRRASYAVRGKIVERANQLEKEGRKIIYCNIGNPQALKQKPLTFPRQVLSLLEYPELLERPETEKIYPRDVIERVRFILKKAPVGLGAYTHSLGFQFVREAVAEFISRRDGIPADPANIALTDGASKGVQAAMTMLSNKREDGFMIPIPQYPLYSATIALYGSNLISYYLDEKAGWQLNEKELAASFEKSAARGINPVAIVVINPGNPTGAVLARENIEMVIRFAKKHNLTVLADEVYQENIYNPERKFISFAKVLYEMKEKDVTLFSFHSVSKGFLGECGHRGGYVEVRNLPPDSFAELLKLQSIGLCANSVGQIMTYLMVDPPKEGDESYPLYRREREAILSDLKAKARMLSDGINAVSGMHAGVPQGAMYSFVRFEVPDDRNTSAMSEEELGLYSRCRDNEYCLKLLEETGICVVPGSGFGQQPNTLHFRTTFLPPKDEIKSLVDRIGAFHKKYTESKKRS